MKGNSFTGRNCAGNVTQVLCALCFFMNSLLFYTSLWNFQKSCCPLQGTTRNCKLLFLKTITKVRDKTQRQSTYQEWPTPLA